MDRWKASRRFRKTRATSARGKRPALPQTELGGGLAPALTSERARTLALLLMAGLSPSEAVCYFLPERGGHMSAKLIATIAARWMRHRETTRAIDALNGGAWHTLAADDRIRLALDKHYAELARFLYTHDYQAALSKEDISKFQQAREALEAKLDGREGDNPFEQFLEDLKTGKAKLHPARMATPAPLSGVEN